MSTAQAVVWLEISGNCRIQGEYNGERGIHFVFGERSHGQDLTFERNALERFVDLAAELLAMQVPSSRKANRTGAPFVDGREDSRLVSVK